MFRLRSKSLSGESCSVAQGRRGQADLLPQSELLHGPKSKAAGLFAAEAFVLWNAAGRRNTGARLGFHSEFPPTDVRRCKDEAAARTTRLKMEDGEEGSMKERRRALISPWTPSLDLLHSARADEIK